MTTRPALQVLVPAAGGDARAVLAPDDDAALDAHYAPPRLPWLRANMVASLDGAATGADGVSGSINGPADNRVFEALRGWADVVLAGAGTVRAEGYRAPRLQDRLVAARRARGQADHPDLAVVTARGELPDALLADSPWVITTAGAPGLAELRRRLPAHRLLVHDGPVDLAAAVAALTGEGLVRVLAEGGPTLLGGLLAAGVVDELCLTWSPVLVGGPAPRPVDAPAWLDPPVAGRLAGLLLGDGMLLGRWLLRAPRG